MVKFNTIETLRPLFERLNLGKNYTLDNDGYVHKKGCRYPLCNFALYDDLCLHIVFLAFHLIKGKVRTNAKRFEKFVWMCDMCDSIATYGGDIDKYLRDYKFPGEMKEKVYKYIENLICERTPASDCEYCNRKIATFSEEDALKRWDEL